VATRIVQVNASVPGVGQVVNAFNTTVPTAAADLGNALLQVIANGPNGQPLPSGTEIPMTVTVTDLVNS
jgi:hypothetical protein